MIRNGGRKRVPNLIGNLFNLRLVDAESSRDNIRRETED